MSRPVDELFDGRAGDLVPLDDGPISFAVIIRTQGRRPGSLNEAVDLLIEKYDKELVAVYLTAFNASNENRWGNLDTLLAEDERLQFHG